MVNTVGFLQVLWLKKLSSLFEYSPWLRRCTLYTRVPVWGKYLWAGYWGLKSFHPGSSSPCVEVSLEQHTEH